MKKRIYGTYRRRSAAALMALAMLASMTACSGKTSDTTQTTGRTLAPEETTQAAQTSAEQSTEPAADQTSAAAQETEAATAHEPTSALNALEIELAEANAKSGHVMLITTRNYLYSFEEDSRAASVSNYDLFYVGDEMAHTYPELASALDKYSYERNETFKEDFENLKEASSAYARNVGAASDDDEMYFYINMDSFAIRSDTNVVSFFNQYTDFQGGAHGYYTYTGSNFDTSTGALLTLDDVVKDKDALITYLKQELKSQYPDTQFFDLDGFFADAESVNNISFICRYDGVEFLFQPYDLASYADGSQSILVSADRTDILNDKYLDFPETFMSPFCVDSTYYYDVDNDGERETLRIDTKVLSEESGQLGFTISVDGHEYTEDAYAYDLVPYIVETSGKVFAYVVERSDNDYTFTSVYELSDSTAADTKETLPGPQPVYTFYGAQASVVSDHSSYTYEWTDPSALLADTTMDVLGTYRGAKLYQVSSTGELVTYADNYVVLPQDRYLTALKDLTLTEVDHELKEVGDATVASGTKLRIYLSDARNTAYLLDEATDKLYKVTTDSTGWPYTIDGTPEEECFDGIFYAG